MIFARISEMALEEQDRWVLWVPVLFGLGIAIYFALPTEPVIYGGILGLIAIVGIGYRGRSNRIILWCAILIGIIIAGFSAAQYRTSSIDGPILSRAVGPTTVTGQVVRVELFPTGSRLSLQKLRISGVGPAETPNRIRLRVKTSKGPDVGPGDWIRIRARITPPPPPAMPGAFDFQRQAYFKGLGGVGFSYGAPTILTPAKETGVMSLILKITSLRQELGTRISAALSGDTGAVARALMLGDRTGISKKTMEAIRNSGLAHLLAISGLHIGLVAGLLFLGIRGLFSLIPRVSLYYPVKKWAAALALPGAFAYAVITGGSVPTVRALLMFSLVLLAVILDRRGLSIRLVAWAALIVLIFQPESLLGASFQLSFAAVTALIAGHEEITRRRRYQEGERPWWQRFGFVYLAGVALTTVIASTATAPYALFHFNRFADYGLLANLMAVPATALWIMPWALLAFVLMPLGLEALALHPMGWGVNLVLDVAHFVAGIPGAVTVLPSMPTIGIAAMTLGGLWLCLWRGRWRLFGGVGVAAALISITLVQTPDVIVDGEAKLMAVRTADGGLAVSSLRTARFNREIWLRKAGVTEASVWPKTGRNTEQYLTCDGVGCLYKRAGRVVSLTRVPAAHSEDCWTADVLISLVPVRIVCRGPNVVIDRFDLWRNGTHAIWLKGAKIIVRSVNEDRGHRPWVVRPVSRSERKGSSS
ncbi:MAG: DUF4131 domain-containing protein [Rhodospirillaceae bacterium]|jgi:competence protein ComEC|nr:DUF4131 domain-containing protein [Rhodospirillaceae bacterium]MBT6221783.1 DUF4131 domain-containing protein [Rhodospirillaceae bacterium]